MLTKGKHSLHCAQHPSWNPKSQIEIKVNSRRDIYIIYIKYNKLKKKLDVLTGHTAQYKPSHYIIGDNLDSINVQTSY